MGHVEPWIIVTILAFSGPIGICVTFHICRVVIYAVFPFQVVIENGSAALEYETISIDAGSSINTDMGFDRSFTHVYAMSEKKVQPDFLLSFCLCYLTFMSFIKWAPFQQTCISYQSDFKLNENMNCFIQENIGRFFLPSIRLLYLCCHAVEIPQPCSKLSFLSAMYGHIGSELILKNSIVCSTACSS